LDTKYMLVKTLFDYLRKSDLYYCIIGKPVHEKTESVNDIDLILSSASISKLETLLKKLAQDVGARILKNERYGFLSYHLILADTNKMTILKIDVWTKLHWKGLDWLRVDDVLKNRNKVNGVYFVSPVDLGVIWIVKELLHNETIRPHHHESLQGLVSLYSEEIHNICSHYFGKKATSLMLYMVNSNKDTSMKWIKLSFVIKQFCGNPIRTIVTFMSYLLKSLKPRGIFIVLLGPDGSGKTTLAKAAMQTLGKDVFRGTHYIHGRFGLIPRLGKFRRKKGRHKSGDNGFHKPHSRLRAIGYILYYIVDYAIAKPYLFWLRLKGKFVVADRYYYDYLLQPQWSRLPVEVFWFLYPLVPKPDLVVCLECPPQTIYDRKPELSIQEISRQQERSREIRQRLPNAITIRTDVDVEEANVKLCTNVLERLGAEVKLDEE